MFLQIRLTELHMFFMTRSATFLTQLSFNCLSNFEAGIPFNKDGLL